jgi:CBS domain-containing protein
MKPIAQILKSKSDAAVQSVAPDASVQEAAALMARHNVGALLVIDGTQIAGIVSERDIARKVALADERPVRQMAVREVMSAPVQFVNSRHTNEDCMALMTEKRLRHLPVIDDGKLVGLVSIGDLVKDIISEQEFIIHQLEHYITGNLR